LPYLNYNKGGGTMVVNKTNKVTVIGAGQMGAGITQRVAFYGYNVNMIDLHEDILNRSINKITNSLSRQVKKEKIKESEKEEILNRISTSTFIDKAKDSDIVIEAVYEDETMKKNIFAELDKICNNNTVLASNTSSIPIGRIASVTSKPENCIGLHFMNPVPVMSFVEVIKSLRTSDETLDISLNFLSSIGMDYIITKDIPGFLSTRLGLIMLNEAANLLHEGMGTIEDIDKCCKKSLNHPMGPFELMDFIGIDTLHNILNIIYRGTGNSKFFPSPVITRMVESGFYGQKVGKGFYEYTNKK
jgi:3-hydroxybutyryl-CoA dehydrogenase